jgi:serine/threonine-protein phosphatase 2B catalytic subunit
MHRWGGAGCFPSVITVFSAPNYCNEYHNKGAVILIEDDRMNIKQYRDVDHPFHLPGNIDVFKWSMPFLVDKIGDIIKVIYKRKVADSPALAREFGHMNLKALLKEQAAKEQKMVLSDSGSQKVMSGKQVKKYRIVRAKLIAMSRFIRCLKVLR